MPKQACAKQQFEMVTARAINTFEPKSNVAQISEILKKTNQMIFRPTLSFIQRKQRQHLHKHT